MVENMVVFHTHEVVYFSDASEHHVCTPPCEGVPIVVYDHEPSSIIAYSLR